MLTDKYIQLQQTAPYKTTLALEKIGATLDAFELRASSPREHGWLVTARHALAQLGRLHVPSAPRRQALFVTKDGGLWIQDMSNYSHEDEGGFPRYVTFTRVVPGAAFDYETVTFNRESAYRIPNFDAFWIYLES